MQISQFGFSDNLQELESKLILFMGDSNLNYPEIIKHPILERSILENKSMLVMAGYQEMGALKDDLFLQVSKGQIKTNYSNSKKRECNFTLLCTTGTRSGDNIINTICADGCFVNIVVLDLINGLAYIMMCVELETSVKIQHNKFTEMPFKAIGDNFTNPLNVINLIGNEKDVKTQNRNKKKHKKYNYKRRDYDNEFTDF